jgi:hypothetical protein
MFPANPVYPTTSQVLGITLRLGGELEHELGCGENPKSRQEFAGVFCFWKLQV